MRSSNDPYFKPSVMNDPLHDKNSGLFFPNGRVFLESLHESSLLQHPCPRKAHCLWSISLENGKLNHSWIITLHVLQNSRENKFQDCLVDGTIFQSEIANRPQYF